MRIQPDLPPDSQPAGLEVEWTAWTPDAPADPTSAPPQNETPRPAASHTLLRMPEVDPWPEPVDGKVLLDGLAQVLRRFVVLPNWAPETLALWIVHTYAFELRD